tara:strand:- start:6732 stop:7256 length:525 start_codon:yes stop_codon:yes gene_type:complete
MKEVIVRKESFFVADYTGDLAVIDDQIDHVRKYDKGRVVSNVGGFQSNFITFGFEELIIFATKKLNEIGENVRLAAFWINANKGTDWNVPHIHTLDAGWSVVYYHKMCCDKCPIGFTHLVPCVMHEEYKYAPQQGTMIFFDDRMPHCVYPCNQEGHERISIAFNFDKIRDVPQQ